MATTVSRTRPSSILLPSPASPPSTAKRIQFAPLPVLPKSSTDEYDPEPPTEDILVSSSSSSSSSQLSSSTTSTPIISCDLDKSSPDSSVGSSPVTPLTALPSKLTSSPLPPSPQLSWVKKPQISLLRPFKRFSSSSSGSSSQTLTPTPSIDTPRRSITKEDILTLGTVNLFRTASRESTRSSRDNDSSWSLGLSRWSSLGGSTSNFPGGSSSRNQSTQSLASKSSRFSSFSSSSSSSSDSKSNPKTVGQQPKANKYKGTRMLNGRVYGAPKRNPNANPFANARDEEPEFVEWGYGGMGSVKGAKSAGVGSNWERLQGGSIDVGVGGVGAGIGASDAELDDGSGLAWVKRRREERERKAREQKEKEAAEKEKENSESQTNTPVPTRSPTLESIPTLAPESVIHAPPTIDVPPLTDIIESQDGEDAETATKANFPTPTRHPAELDVPPQTEDVQSKAEDVHNAHETERVLQAITVPVRSPRHHHHHRQPSAEGPIAPQVVESPSTAGGDTTNAATSAIHTSTTELEKSISFSSSSSESGSGSEGGFDDDDSDYEEEEEEQESQTQNVGLKSPLGTAAGVEKISRHKE